MKRDEPTFIGELGRAVCQPAAQLVLVGLVFATLLAVAVVARRGQQLDQQRVERDADLLAVLVKQRFDLHRDGLMSLRLAIQPDYDGLKWLGFSNQVESLYPAHNFPAFTEFAFAQRVFDTMRDGFEPMTGARAHARFGLRFPQGRSGEWMSLPVLFHQFVRPHWSPVPGTFTHWGLDLNQDDEERDAMRWAWGGDRLATTRGGPSVWGDGTKGTVRLYLPVWSETSSGWETWSNTVVSMKGRSGLTPEQSRESVRANANLIRLAGMLCGTLDVPRLLATAFPSNAPALAVAIDDGPANSGAHRLAGGLPASSYLRTERIERYYGRDWRFQFATTPTWEATSLRRWPWAVLLAGGTVSGVAGVAAGFWAQGRERDRAARLAAEQQSRELQRARDNLHSVQAARQQLQRNLHDAVLQRLYAATLHARRTQQSAGRGEPVSAGELEQHVGELDTVMDELRGFLSGTVRAELGGAELGSALRGLGLAFGRQSGLTVTVEAETDALAAVPAECGEHLLQMAREGLSNAWRHGGAKSAVVRLSRQQGQLALEVTDDGGGFDPQATANGGHGLANLAERAAQCGGVFEVTSRAGGPTTLWATFPARTAS